MNSHYTYLFVDVGCIIIPLAASFLPSIKFYTHWRNLAAASAITAAIFIGWDILFTKWGVWSFNSRYVLGANFINLPAEEMAFFICIPYACTFTFYCINRFVKQELPLNIFLFVTWLLALLAAYLAVTHINKLYTSVTCTFLAALLAVLATRRANFLPSFYISFILTLIPFFISNGILTGAWTDEPIVSYNDRYNMGMRIFTIPVEDILYGMLLQLLNISLFIVLPGHRKTLPSAVSGPGLNY